jgi:enamine deaminase RidA (YjgF/YER057c/UK114 family)
MVTSPALTLCGPGSQTATSNNDEVLDGDDAQEFYLHTASGTTIGTTIGTSGTPSFTFGGGMTYGTTYYISSVVGNDLGGGVVDVADPCLSVSAGTPVTWFDLPTVTAGPDQTVCENATVILNGAGATSYAWDNGVTNGIGFIVTATTTYNVTGTDVNGCSNTDALIVTVNAAPAVNAGTDQAACVGDMVTLSGSGAVTYTWNNGVTDGTAFAASSTTTYTVTGADGAGCTNTDIVIVTVNPLPTVDAGVDQAVCSGNMVTLSGTGAVTYTWDNGVSDGTAFAATTTTTYTVTGIDANNCSNTDLVTVTVTAGPAITGVITHDDGSSNGTIDASITGGVAPYTVSWDNGETTEDITNLAAGDYTITVTDANGCVSMMTFTVLATVGIENELDKQLLIFPNPTEGTVNIQLEGDYSLTILDARGRLVHTSNQADNATVDLTSFEAGVYFLSVQRGTDNAMRRIILE